MSSSVTSDPAPPLRSKIVRLIARWITVAILSLWLGSFVIIRMTGYRIGFDLDDTLSCSSPSFDTARAAGLKHGTPEYWQRVNNTFEMDPDKKAVIAAAMLFKVTGFYVDIIIARNGTGGEALMEEWDWLSDRFYFEREKSRILAADKYLLYFGDSDSDIEHAQEAGITGIRVLRGDCSSRKSYKYNPGSFGEPVMPFSEGPGASDDR